MKNNYTFRLAKQDDAKALVEIYAPFVISEDSAVSDVSFEYEVPSVDEFAGRIKKVLAVYPYIVCEQDGKAVGYVYAHPYIERAAYQWGAEVTVYLSPAAQGRGIGRVMYNALEKILRMQGIITLYSCITASNEHSVKMHEAAGYKIIGDFKNAGFKHGHWLDMVWMEKNIAQRPVQPEPVKKISEISQSEIERILMEAALMLQ